MLKKDKLFHHSDPITYLPSYLGLNIRNPHLLHNEGFPCTATSKSLSLLKITASKDENYQGLPPPFSKTGNAQIN